VPRLNLAFAVALAFGVTAGVAGAPAPVLAVGEDPVAEWDKQWQSALKDSAADYVKLCKAFEANLEATTAYVRRRILRYLPEDEETRKYLGYTKARQADGTDKWERVDIRKDEIAAMVDLDDPKATKFPKQLTELDKKVANRFRGLALKAKENFAKDPSTDAGWQAKGARAWEKVVELDPKNDQAHKELKHEKYAGEYCSKFKIQFMKVRDARKQAGAKTANAKVDATPCDIDGAMVNAGLTGGGAKSAHMTINTSHGKDVAVRLAQRAEQALMDVCEIYGFPETIKERLNTNKISVVKDQEEYKTFLEKAAKWNKAQIQRYVDAGFFGTGFAPGEFVSTRNNDAAADDQVMNLTANSASRAAQSAARAELASSVKDELEDWLWQSIGYDTTKRVLGTALTIWGAFGRYGQNVEARAGVDVWVELARRQVEEDNDVRISRLHKLKIEKQEFKGRETVKGWAFLQFLFEKDPATAKTFIWNVLANGTPAACATVYPDNPDAPDPEKSMEKLDDEYREWITKAW
jgi:hypothetical protein